VEHAAIAISGGEVDRAHRDCARLGGAFGRIVAIERDDGAGDRWLEQWALAAIRDGFRSTTFRRDPRLSRAVPRRSS
jgi:hypothetical protein